jgi:hypothetical protein
MSNLHTYPLHIPDYGAAAPVLQCCPKTQGLINYISCVTKAPYELVLASTLSSYSILLQGLIDVERPNVGRGPVSLYTLCVAESGERKSTIGKLLDKPVMDYQETRIKDCEHATAIYDVDMEIHRKRRKFLIKKLTHCDSKDEDMALLREELHELERSRPCKPASGKILLEDATPEALASQLSEGDGSVALVSQEGGSILGGRIVQNLSMLNKLWAGESWTVSRKASESFIVSDGRLAVSIMVQPKTLEKFMKARGEQTRDIGFLARFVVCYPLSTQGNRLIHYADNVNDYYYQDYLCAAEEILADVEVRSRSKSGKQVMHFSAQATTNWIYLFNYIETQLNLSGRFSFARDHGSKLAENIARIAALLAYIEEGGICEISSGILQDAITLAFYFSDTFLRLFSILPDYVMHDGILREHLQTKREGGERYIKKNHIRQSGPSLLRSKVILDGCLHRLAHSGEIAILVTEANMHVIDLYPSMPPDRDRWNKDIILKYGQ